MVAVKRLPLENEPAAVYHHEMWGSRKGKYDSLWSQMLSTVQWTKLKLHHRYLMFDDINHALLDRYDASPSLDELMPHNGVGIVTAHDEFVVGPRAQLIARFDRFRSAPANASLLHEEFNVERKKGWDILKGHAALRSEKDLTKYVRDFLYRPFDKTHIFYEDRLVWRTVRDVMEHLHNGPNFAILTTRMSADDHAFFIADSAMSNKAGSRYDQSYAFPLYLYPSPSELDQTRRVNFDAALYAKLRKLAAHPARGEPDEVAVFDYIYGVLHCPAYRETYAEFLKIDFPRIPWPPSPDVFWDVSDKGGQLRRLHLMEPAAIGDMPCPFVGDEREGRSKVEKVEYRDGAVWINAHQRFENAPAVSWGFYIGGYQPAQKWLKDRKGRALDYADVQHYQRILKILAETDRIMKTIEMPLG